ncbi:helix-turn-helix transcriptional regulator [Maribellus sp. CM-23]|uniref:helix-turn-helix domain-containing protein n=1 Tax=Maribellus sp. CM-23 TaxID=2781026 RepID=UPI001F27B0D8|nr:AraC family transcriptional regulator [Maribellus sp. CM-23]MCE4566204.1 helix-turn-helix transcriptional regulator [Maribellus sp. CM-23]
MKYIFLIAAFNALFFAVLTLQKKKALHDKILISWLSYLGLYTGAYALFFNRLFMEHQLLSAAFVSLLMLHGPFLYLYISALIDQKFRLNRKNMLHFVPFLLFNLFLLVASFSPGISAGIRLDHTEGDHGTPLLFNIFLLLTALSGPFYFGLSIALFRKLDINIFNNFSSQEPVNPDWLRKLVYTFGAIWTALIVFASIHHVFHLFSWIFCTHGLFLTLSVFIILIGYFGLKQQEIFIQYPDQNVEYVTETKTKYSTTILKETDAEQYARRLKHFMASEKPHLDPNLSLPELAGKLEIPSHQLSRVINEQFGINFFEFINQYRIEEVKARIGNPAFDQLSLLGIAFESGFNTKSAFNRVFKKLTGITPSEYKNRISKNTPSQK